MSYQVRYTEITNPAKPALIVEDKSLNAETSLTFVGKNYAGYAPVLAENLLHLLENFAKNSSPPNPVQGQLWYDTSASVNLLKIYDGITWTAAGSVKKANAAPVASASIIGDLWVNTSTQQLYLFSGSSWILIGPQFSSGLKTGASVETIVDTNNIEHNVITLFADDNRISIVSKASFTPKNSISGFTAIYQGINLSSIDSSSTTTPVKFWGTASQADALVINNSTVPSSKFLRNDQISVTNFPFNVRNKDGITIGSDYGFSISSEANNSKLESKGSISFNVNTANNSTTSVYIDSALKVGIGANNINPQETLDVAGNILTNGKLIVTGAVDATVNGEGSIKTLGGLYVKKSSVFTGSVSTYGQILVNNFDINGDPTYGAVIMPGSAGGNIKYDIGSESLQFGRIYANYFKGNFEGTFTGSVAGSVSGTAARLASATTFSLTGDVSSEDLEFTGQTISGRATFVTSISDSIITAKTAVADSVATDLLLVYRSGANGGLKKVSKQTFISNIPTIPIGAILPYSGLVAPSGYLLCDGSEILIGTYSELFSIIGYSYKSSGFVGKNTFALPDLRGRFPLGRDNMDNNLTVPSVTDEQILVNAGGNSANRVTSTTADTVGQGAGSDEKTLLVSNLPNHTHNLNSGSAQYFAAGLPGASADPNAIPNRGMPAESTGFGLPNSGGISGTTGAAFNSMNPYLTINYIIFTGVL